MKNEKNFKLEKSDVEHYRVNVVDGIITSISYSSQLDFTPNNNPYEFLYHLNNIVNIWKKEDSNTYEEFMNSLRDSEKEKYISKNSELPLIFSVSGKEYPEYKYYTSLTVIEIIVFNSKIFSISKNWRHFKYTPLDGSPDFYTYLHYFVNFLLSNDNYDYYYEFLNSLCDEEKEKYFQPSYLPKNYK